MGEDVTVCGAPPASVVDGHQAESAGAACATFLPGEDQPVPEELPEPEAGPITERPMPLMLNAPVIQTADGSNTAAETPDNPLRSEPFRWGELGGLDEANPIRGQASPVRQAAFVGEIGDAN